MTGKAQTIAACLALCAIGLSACGVRGSLELPPEQKAAQQSTATAESGQGKPRGAAPKKHQSFILDGLLQ